MSEEQLAFGWEAPPQQPTGLPQRAEALRRRLQVLAAQRIYLGTSSWKYPGWLGQIYSEQRYQTRGQFAQKKFERECLAEYASVFPTVGGDFSFYQFPSAALWQRTLGQLPAHYKFSLKVPEDVTVSRFPEAPRYGARAGTVNGHFMDAAVVRDELLAPLELYHDQLGVILFEFGTIHDSPCAQVEPFAEKLETLLAALPTQRFTFAVEVRNREFLYDGSPYLECLRRHRVAHCFNSWTRMPDVHSQLETPGTRTAGHVAARLLLRPGRTYQQAVEQFSPYQRVQDPYPEGRAALCRLIEQCRQQQQTLFAFVNNRFEGNAIETIEGVLDDLERL